MNTMVVKRKKKIVPLIVFLILFIAFITGSAAVFFYVIKPHLTKQISLSSIEKAWLAQDYENVYELSNGLLLSDPFHNAARVYHGYAGFYLSVAQTDTIQSQVYLDESINSLRIALYTASEAARPQICYMLGKAYFYKNTLSSYNYYADLAIKYLNAAQQNGYQMDDIPEYLGLSYASLDMRGESLKAFTNALLVRESDMLLLAIAEQYYGNGQADAAKPYLFRLRNSQNDIILLKSKNLLAKIYIDEGNYADAQAEYEFILEKDPNSADAYYGLGVIYEKQGDLVRARAEWRKALRIQVDHPEALQKIADNT